MTMLATVGRRRFGAGSGGGVEPCGGKCTLLRLLTEFDQRLTGG